MRKLWLLLVLSLPCSAQVGNGIWQFVWSAPSGACSQSAQPQMVMGPGTLYTCQTGTWAIASGGGAGSGTVNPGTASQIAYYPSTAAAVSGDPALTDSGTILNYTGTMDAVAFAATGAFAGQVSLGAGTAQGTVANSFSWMAPASIPTGYNWIMPSADCNGLFNVSSDVVTCVAQSGLTNVVYKNAANAFTSAGTIDLTLAAPTNGFLLPAPGGSCGAVVAGALCHNGNNYIGNIGGSPNGIAFAGSITNNTIPKWNSSTLALFSNSSITDDATTVSTSEIMSASRFTSTVSTGTAPLTVTSTTNVANLNASSLGGKTAVGTDAGLASAATISTTAGQPVCSTANGGVSTTSCPVINGVGTENGAANALAVTVTGFPAAIQANLCVTTVVAGGHGSSGATTLTVTPTGGSAYAAIAVMKRTTAGVAAIGTSADINAGGLYTFCYDGTQWVTQTPSSTAYISGVNAAGQVMLGNSNNQMVSSNKVIIANATGAFTTYNAVATTGVGMSAVYAAPSVITIGSGTSIGNTSLCSTTLCPAGTYTVHAYLDITTACGTTGTYSVNLLWTDDQGAKTAVINFNGTGSVPATGLVTTTSTANFGQEAQIIRTTGAANNALGSINYSTTAAACGTGGPMVGNLYLSVTREM